MLHTQVLFSEERRRFLDPEGKHEHRLNIARTIFNQHADEYCNLFLESAPALQRKNTYDENARNGTIANTWYYLIK